VIVSSDLHYRGKIVWEDLQFENRKYAGVAAYNQSKLANVLFANALARRLADKNISVNSLHPGVVATELTRELPGFLRALWNFFLLPPAQGAQTSLHVALADEGAEVSGAYFDKSRRKKASRAALDEAAQEKLWALSEDLLGLRRAESRAA